MLTNLKQYNEEFGCDYGNHSGKIATKENKDGTFEEEKRLFSIEILHHNNRTQEKTLNEAREAVRLSIVIIGMKESSVLHLIS